MATVSSLVDRVRLELGDLGKSFVTQFIADGTTNRFKLHYSPIDATTVTVYATPAGGSATDISSTSYVEESTGVLVTQDIPADGTELNVSGTYYRYFTGAELTQLVTAAVDQHSAGHIDSLGRKMTIDTLPMIEEYPVSVYATTLALYTLATDSAFDIDIAAPDGVSIPRTERYRQLMEMIQTRQQQYRELCVMLGVGLYRIDVTSLRRISKATGRYVPVYTPQEVDDRSYPHRVEDQLPTYGDRQVEWPSDSTELTAYQGRAFTTTFTVNANYAGKNFVANLLNQRGSVLKIQEFDLVVSTTGISSITAASRTAGSTTISLTTSTAHGLTTGDSVAITDVDTTVNGIGAVTVVDTTHFTVTGTATTALALTGLTGAAAEKSVVKDYTFTLSLTADETLRLAEKAYWSLCTIDAYSLEHIEIKGANFFTARVSSVVL
jgi:hypothetical protein